MKGYVKVKHVYRAVGLLLGLVASNGAWGEGAPFADGPLRMAGPRVDGPLSPGVYRDPDEVNIENRIERAVENGGLYGLREDVLGCYHSNMPPLASMKGDMDKQREAISKSVGLKYCALENEKAFDYVWSPGDSMTPPHDAIHYWFYGDLSTTRLYAYEMLFFVNWDQEIAFMHGKYEMHDRPSF